MNKIYILLFIIIFIFPKPIFTINNQFSTFMVIEEISTRTAKKNGIILDKIKISPEIINRIYDFSYGGKILIGKFLKKSDGKLEIFHTTRRLRGKRFILIPKFNKRRNLSKTKLILNENDEKSIVIKNCNIHDITINNLLFLKDIRKKILSSKLFTSPFLEKKDMKEVKIYFDIFKNSKGIEGLNIINFIKFDEKNYIVNTEAPDIGYGKTSLFFSYKDGRKKSISPIYFKHFTRENKDSIFYDFFSNSLIIVNKNRKIHSKFDAKKETRVLSNLFHHFILKKGVFKKDDFLKKNLQLQIEKLFKSLKDKLNINFEWNGNIDNIYLDLTRFYFRINLEFIYHGKKIGESHIPYVFELDSNILSRVE